MKKINNKWVLIRKHLNPAQKYAEELLRRWNFAVRTRFCHKKTDVLSNKPVIV